MNNLDLETQINNEQRNVSYDTKEYTVEYIVDKYLNQLDEDANEFFIPDYQREFVWDDERQSRFIESLLIGLPIPYIFLAETKDGRYEIVDGSQRIRTLAAFLNNELKIGNIDILTNLRNLKFSQLELSRQRKFKNISLKMIVLDASTTDKTKNELFERINRGSDLLKDMEKRKGIYRGKFNDFIYKTAKDTLYKKLTPIAKWFEKRQEREELLLRYFAFLDWYPHFKGQIGIARQLDNYLDKKNNDKNFDDKKEESLINEFRQMLKFVERNLKNGFSKQGNQVSRVYFEALSVGITLAIKENNSLLEKKMQLDDVVKSKEFLEIISGKYHTHTPKRILARIDFIKKKILENQ